MYRHLAKSPSSSTHNPMPPTISAQQHAHRKHNANIQYLQNLSSLILYLFFWGSLYPLPARAIEMSMLKWLKMK